MNFLVSPITDEAQKGRNMYGGKTLFIYLGRFIVYSYGKMVLVKHFCV